MTRGATPSPREEGQIAILIIGLFVVVLVFLLGAIDVTAAQLARMRLLDTADAVALDAADALDVRAAYARGVDALVLLSDASVREVAGAHLARTPRPTGISAWTLVEPTGTSDGTTAVVSVRGRATLPMTGWILESLGGGVTITVTSRARAPLN